LEVRGWRQGRGTREEKKLRSAEAEKVRRKEGREV